MLSDEEAECRICRGAGESRRPLFHPCKCSGSIKYTHEDCLVNWLSQAGTSRCELCHHPFRFEPMYQPNTPQALPTDELLVGALVRARSTVLTATRVGLVLTVWLFLLPLGTCWTWYALFIRSLSQLPGLISGRGFSGVVTDAFYGCLLSAGIVFVFLGVSSLREYIRHIPEDGGDANVFQDDLADVDEFDIDNDLGHPPNPPVGPHEDDAPVQEPPLVYVANGDGFLANDGSPAGRRGADTLQQADGTVAGAGEDGRLVYDAQPPEGGLSTAEMDLSRDASAGSEEFKKRDSGRLQQGETLPGVAGGSRGPNVSGEAEASSAHPQVNDHPVRRRPRTGLHSQDSFGTTEHGGPMRDVDGDADGNAAARMDTDSSDMFEDLYAGDMPHLVSSDSDDDGIFDEDDEESEAGEDEFMMGAAAGGPFPVAGLAEGGVRNPHGGEGVHDGVEGDDEALEDEQNDDGGALFGLFELDPDEVPLEEMVGLRGHLRHLFDNAGTVLVSNAIFLVIFTLIPLLVGRLALRVASLHSFPLGVASQYLAAFDARPSVDTMEGREASEMQPTNTSGAKALRDDAEIATNIAAGQVDPSLSDGPVVAYVDNLFVVLLGYGVISLGAFGYVIVNSVLRSRYPRLDTPMTRQVFRVLRYLATFAKIVVLIVFEFGIFPLGCGWWLDVCTLKLLNSTLESRTSFCREFPWTCSAGHWFLGIFYMVHVSLFVSLLREVLRPQLLWFLRNPDDPDFRPFRELVEKPLSRHARRMCLSVCIYAPLIFAVVYVPSWLCLTFLPTVFPFNLSDFSSSLLEIPFGNLLVVPLVSMVHHVRPGAVLRRLVREWIEATGHILGIAHLVVKDEAGDADGEGDGQEGDEDIDIVDGDVFDPFDDADIDDQGQGNGEQVGFEHVDQERLAEGRNAEIEIGNMELPGVTHVWVRGVVMLILGWGSFIFCECVALVVPTVIGRTLLKVVGLSASHDFHALGVGFYVILGGLELACRLYSFLSAVGTQNALGLVMPYAVIVVKSLLLALLWFGVAPLGAGLLVELVITIPLRVSHNESPYFYLQQDWALGVLLIKVCSRIGLAGGFNALWRDRLERVGEGGFLGAGQNFGRTFREVIGPVLWVEAIALSVPYAFAHGVLRVLGASHATMSFVYRYIYIWFVCVHAMLSTVDKFKAGLHALHDSIRDDKYLVGRRLYNYSRTPAPVQQLS